MATKQKAPAEERRYRLITKAPHQHDDGMTYTHGKVIRDTRNLVAMFPNKFEDLDPKPDEDASAGLQQITDKLMDVLDIPEAHARRLAKLSGLKSADEVTEDDEEGEETGAATADRRGPAPGKANAAVPGRESTAADEAIADNSDDEEERPAARTPKPRAASTTTAADEEDKGVELTDDFEGAKDKGYQIFKQGREYKAFKAGKPVRDATFTKKGEVEEFLEGK
jgi:hypothetical protein